MTRHCLVVLLLLYCFPGYAAEMARRTVRAERTTEQVRLDGEFREGAWQKARWESGFHELRRTGVVVEVQTKVAALHDERNLYIGIIAEDPTVAGLVAKVTQDERRVFDDDSIEIFLNPHAYQEERYFWMCFNSLGTRSDGKGIQAGAAMDKSWNGNWKVATAVGKGQWRAEVKVPYYALEIDDQVGDTWRFNVGRNYKSGKKPVWSTLNPLPGGFQDAPGFGFLTGLDKSLVSAFAWEVGRPVFTCIPKDEQMQVEVTVPVKNSTGKPRELAVEAYLISPQEKVAVAKVQLDLADSETKEIIN